MSILSAIRSRIRPHVTFLPMSWLRSTRRLQELVQSWDAGLPTARSAKVPGGFAVVITPWLATAVPWFSIVAGLFLSRVEERVLFIMDDIPFGVTPVRFRSISFCIRRVLRVVARSHSAIYLSDYQPKSASTSEYSVLIQRLAALNAVHALRGETIPAGRARYIDTISRQLQRSEAAINELVRRESFRAVFIPGGIYGSTGLWADAAARAGIRVASHDAGGYGVLMLAADGIASQLQDVPRAFSMLKQSADFAAEKPFIIATAQAEMAKRRSGTDAFASQLKTAGGPLDEHRGGVLIALNSSWDQAALGLHVVFEDSAEWIFETVRWVLESTSYPVIVRQHPAERLPAVRSSDDYRKLLGERFPNEPRLHFIAADDPINTYELLQVVSVVAAYTSTVGVEAAALGKVVVTPSRSYYSQLGFVWNALTRDEYFDRLRAALEGECTVTQAMREDALCCYYLAQICNWIHTVFSPEAFTAWSALSLQQLNEEPGARLTVSCLSGNHPAALLNHQLKWQASRLAKAV
jgi:hypothetical protein